MRLTHAAVLAAAALVAALAGPGAGRARAAGVPAAAPVASPPAADDAAVDPDLADCPAEPAPLTAEEAAAGLREAADSGFLWKATRDGRAVYLYGTIHIAQRAWMFPGPHVLAALRASDTVVLELDPTDPDIVARLQRAIARRPGSPSLPADVERRLRAQILAACMEPSALEGLRPEMRAVTVEVMAARRMGLQPAYGIDTFVAQLGRQLKKPLRSLETPEAQAALLFSDDPRETTRSVLEILDELESGAGPRILGRLADAWRHGDLDDISAYGDWCDCLKTDRQRAEFARLVDARNPTMADRIVEMHAQGGAQFVAVGSLHMVGAIGLPALLRERGFDVRRVEYDQR